MTRLSGEDPWPSPLPSSTREHQQTTGQILRWRDVVIATLMKMLVLCLDLNVVKKAIGGR